MLMFGSDDLLEESMQFLEVLMEGVEHSHDDRLSVEDEGGVVYAIRDHIALLLLPLVLLLPRDHR